MEGEKGYAVLGIHEAGYVPGVESGRVARVRIFVGEEMIDEDFKVPDTLPGVPQTNEVCEQLVKADVEKRYSELLSAHLASLSPKAEQAEPGVAS